MIVLVAAQEVGASNALAPVIEGLRGHKDIAVHVLAAGNASSVFTSAGVKHETLNADWGAERESSRTARQLLERLSPDVLILGTAWGASIDKALLKQANATGIPSLSIVDMWSNYKERFLDFRTCEMNLPSKVALMDELALQQALEAGLPEPVLAVTGQPFLESLKGRIYQQSIISKSKELRQSWLNGTAESVSSKIVLFVSEAISKDFGAETEYYRGYTEIDAVKGLTKAVEMLSRVSNSYINIVVKLHPEESKGMLEHGINWNGGEPTIVSEVSPWPCVLAADVVVGMTSMLLLESSIAGVPTISFQPGVEETSAFYGTSNGAIPLVSSVGELAAKLDELLERKRGGELNRIGCETPCPTANRGATRRIVDLAMELGRMGAAT